MIHYRTTNSLTEAFIAKQKLLDLQYLYPDFNYWFSNKCLPGIVIGSDKMIIAKHDEQIIGLAIGKVSDNEKKLRCVRVRPDYQQRGVGIHLVDKMLREIDCDKPIATVSEEMLHDFARPFVNHFNFDLTSVNKGMYRRGKLEYIFNEDRNESTSECSNP